MLLRGGDQRLLSPPKTVLQPRSTKPQATRKNSARTLRNHPNPLLVSFCRHFAARDFSAAIEAYSCALDAAPLDTPQDHKDASVYYANRAAAFMGLQAWDDAVRDCSDALELQPEYIKARLRRAHAYEQLEKLDEALVDYKRLLELQPGMPEAVRATPRLERAIKARDEKLKEEMMGKLKDLGNSILGNFGLSTDNFQFKQDPNTGGYNINFVQNTGSAPAGGKQ